MWILSNIWCETLDATIIQSIQCWSKLILYLVMVWCDDAILMIGIGVCCGVDDIWFCLIIHHCVMMMEIPDCPWMVPCKLVRLWLVSYLGMSTVRLCVDNSEVLSIVSLLCVCWCSHDVMMLNFQLELKSQKQWF